MKHLFLASTVFIFCFLNFHSAFGQIDTGKHSHNPVILKKGFYKTYREFLDNSPSILIKFSTTLLAVSKEDQTIVGAKYAVIDTTDMFGDFWGFCDGENIFVPYGGGFFETQYWKLQCAGPNPYFFHLYKTMFFIRDADIMFIDHAGRPVEYTEYNIKKLFKDNKPLLKEYKKELFPYAKWIIQFIIRYNEERLKK